MQMDKQVFEGKWRYLM